MDTYNATWFNSLSNVAGSIIQPGHCGLHCLGVFTWRRPTRIKIPQPGPEFSALIGSRQRFRKRGCNTLFCHLSLKTPKTQLIPASKEVSRPPVILGDRGTKLFMAEMVPGWIGKPESSLSIGNSTVGWEHNSNIHGYTIRKQTCLCLM